MRTGVVLEAGRAIREQLIRRTLPRTAAGQVIIIIVTAQLFFFRSPSARAPVYERIFGLRAVYTHTRSPFFSHPSPRDRVVYFVLFFIIVVVLLSAGRVIGTRAKSDPPE